MFNLWCCRWNNYHRMFPHLQLKSHEMTVGDTINHCVSVKPVVVTFLFQLMVAATPAAAISAIPLENWFFHSTFVCSSNCPGNVCLTGVSLFADRAGFVISHGFIWVPILVDFFWPHSFLCGWNAIAVFSVYVCVSVCVYSNRYLYFSFQNLEYETLAYCCVCMCLSA